MFDVNWKIQIEEDISPTSLNVTGERSSRFKLVVNAYGCFVESDEHNKGHKIAARSKHLGWTWALNFIMLTHV